MGSSLVVQWLGLGAFTAEGPGSIWLGNEDPTSRRALPKKKKKGKKGRKKEALWLSNCHQGKKDGIMPEPVRIRQWNLL